jgi:hypothetical protein
MTRHQTFQNADALRRYTAEECGIVLLAGGSPAQVRRAYGLVSAVSRLSGASKGEELDMIRGLAEMLEG